MTDSRMWYYDPETDQWGLLPAGGGGGGLGAGTPIGVVTSYVGSTAPEGWHLCDGSAHGSAELEALIGSPNTPDLRGRFLLAASAGHAAGSTGGAETHTLTAAEMPVHNHGMDTESAFHTHGGTTAGVDRAAVHGHGVSGGNVGGTASATVAGGVDHWAAVGHVSGIAIELANTDHLHAFNTGAQSPLHVHGIHNAGGGGAHNNMPPFYAIVYIIKAFTDADAAVGFTREEADARFVNVDGDTMEGPLGVGTLTGTFTDGVRLTTGMDARGHVLIGSGQGSNGTVFVDNISPNNSWRTRMLAPLELRGAPTEPLHAATKEYVDTPNPMTIFFGQPNVWVPAGVGAWGAVTPLPCSSGEHVSGGAVTFAAESPTTGQMWLSQGIYRFTMFIFSDSGEPVTREVGMQTFTSGVGWSIYPFTSGVAWHVPGGFAGGGTAPISYSAVVRAMAGGQWARFVARTGPVGSGANMGIGTGNVERLSSLIT